MKKVLFFFALVAIMGTMATKSYAQLTDEEYNYVTMDLRGILNLTMTTNPQVDFVFKTVQEYNQGITRFNATQLEVDATLAWDLYVYANADTWTQVEAYSTNGESALPAEILEIRSSVDNSASGAVHVSGAATTSLFGPTSAALGAGNAPTAATQYLAGAFGTAAGESFAPGTANNNPTTHKFRIDMELHPGIPATFASSTVAIGGVGYAQAGYYYIEVVYSLIEDL